MQTAQGAIGVFIFESGLQFLTGVGEVRLPAERCTTRTCYRGRGLHAKLRAFAIKSVHDAPNPFTGQHVGFVRPDNTPPEVRECAQNSLDL